MMSRGSNTQRLSSTQRQHGIGTRSISPPGAPCIAPAWRSWLKRRGAWRGPRAPEVAKITGET